jgi:hypothetical protein
MRLLEGITSTIITTTIITTTIITTIIITTTIITTTKPRVEMSKSVILNSSSE